MHLRVYNYNTMEKVKEWEAHTDYIRFIEVHPNRPLVLSSSDDMTIKMWDWDKDFECVQTFEGHAHYVMMVRFNPRDSNTFASASLDRSIKVWGLTASTAHFSLEGNGSHEKGVNCIDYYPGGDKPYLLSGADDRTVKIWDYQTKACIQTLEGHAHNVTSVCFHPRLPLIISSSEDGTVRLWHSVTYRSESTLNYGLERAWALAPTKDANKLAIGYDEGTVVIKLGNERPVASLDTNTGKLVWALSHEIQTMTLKGLSADAPDGEKLTVAPRDMGACEVYPQALQHNSNGSFIAVCGDGEFIIYTSQALRNKTFGSALDFVWSALGTGDYAVRESISRVKTFKNFKEHKTLTLPMSSAEGIYGGACLAVKGADCVVFFDWEEGEFIRKIDVVPTSIYWNEAGDSVVIACVDTYFVLRFDRDAVASAFSNGSVNAEEGVDGSFELDTTISDAVRTGQWVGDCFLYTNSAGKLNYFVGGQVMTLSHLDHRMYLLGYVPKEDRAFLIDKTYNVVSYKLQMSVLNYQTAVVRGEFDSANVIFQQIPKSELLSVARFLESQGHKELALQATPDADHRFELAVDLRKMELAHQVLLDTKADDTGSTDYQSKWRRLGDLALGYGDIKLALDCAEKSGDLSGLLLLYSSVGDKKGMLSLAGQAKDAGRSNVAFLAYFITGHVEECIQLLVDTGRVPEAAFMARTYMPSRISSVLELWKADLKVVNEKAAEALADPARYPNLFTDLEFALRAEELFRERRGTDMSAGRYSESKGELDLNLIELVKTHEAMPLPRTQTADLDDDEDADEDSSDEMPGSKQVNSFEDEADDVEDGEEKAEEEEEAELAEDDDDIAMEDAEVGDVVSNVDEEEEEKEATDVDEAVDVAVDEEEDVDEDADIEEEVEELTAKVASTTVVPLSAAIEQDEVGEDEEADVDALLAGGDDDEDEVDDNDDPWDDDE
jgi:coatomer subunit beta'